MAFAVAVALDSISISIFCFFTGEVPVERLGLVRVGEGDGVGGAGLRPPRELVASAAPLVGGAAGSADDGDLLGTPAGLVDAVDGGGGGSEVSLRLLGVVRVLRVGRADAVRQARGTGGRAGVRAAGSPARAETRAGEARGGEESAGVRPRRARRGRAHERHEARRGDRRPDATARSRARGVPLAILVRLDVTRGGDGRDVRGHLREEGRALSHRARARRGCTRRARRSGRGVKTCDTDAVCTFGKTSVRKNVTLAVEEITSRAPSFVSSVHFTIHRPSTRPSVSVVPTRIISAVPTTTRRVENPGRGDETPPGRSGTSPNSPRADARVAFPREFRRVPRVTHD